MIDYYVYSKIKNNKNSVSLSTNRILGKGEIFTMDILYYDLKTSLVVLALNLFSGLPNLKAKNKLL